MKEMRVAIYARVSTNDQNCEMQLTELRDYVKARKWDNVGEFVDTGFSGFKGVRPAQEQCKKLAQQRKIDCVMVWKIDRWARTVKQLSNDICDFDSLGIRFISLTQGIDTDKDNPTSRLIINVLAAIAEFERGIIYERVMAGIQNAKVNGTKSGNAIGRPKQIFNRDKVKELRASGISFGEIAKQMDLSKSTVKRVCDGI